MWTEYHSFHSFSYTVYINLAKWFLLFPKSYLFPYVIRYILKMIQCHLNISRVENAGQLSFGFSILYAVYCSVFHLHSFEMLGIYNSYVYRDSFIVQLQTINYLYFMFWVLNLFTKMHRNHDILSFWFKNDRKHS